MKKLLLFLIFGACFFGIYAQGTGANANAFWSLTGNAGTTTRNFLGTTDSVPLIFKTSNMEWMRLLPSGYLGIGTDQPQEKLHIENGGILVSKTLTGAPNSSNHLLGIRVIDGQSGIGNFWGLGYLSENGSTGLHLSVAPINNLPIIYSQLFLATNGFVGIGNKKPQATLDVSGDIRADNISVSGLLTAKNATISEILTANQFNAQNANISGTLTTNNLSIDGNLGLGTNDPQAKLHVHEGDILISTTEGKAPGEGGSIFFERQPNVFGPGWAIGYTDFNDKFGLNFCKPWNPYMQHVLFLSDMGDIGIGTGTPKQKLHIVDGNILISKTSAKAPQSANGSILFGANTDDNCPMGRWGIEYLNGEDGVFGLNFWRPWNPGTGAGYDYALFLANSNNVGIGTKNPTARLDVAGALKAASASITGALSANSATISGISNLNGNVTVGTTSQQAQLDVNGTVNAKSANIAGKIKTKEVQVTLAGWPDYVFNKDYNLLTLNEVEQFIAENSHLPNVPSAAQVEANGINLGEMNAILIQKVEELTLYILNLQKQINELKNSKP